MINYSLDYWIVFGYYNLLCILFQCTTCFQHILNLFCLLFVLTFKIIIIITLAAVQKIRLYKVTENQLLFNLYHQYLLLQVQLHVLIKYSNEIQFSKKQEMENFPGEHYKTILNNFSCCSRGHNYIDVYIFIADFHYAPCIPAMQ